MPRKKSTTRRKSTRKPRKRRIPRLRLGMPQSQTVKLRYVQPVQLDASTSSLAEYAWNLNNIFRPDYTTSSYNGQPRFFDHYAKVYQQYTVLGAKVTAVITAPTQTTSSVGQYCGFLPSAELPYIQTPNADLQRLMEVPHLKRRLRKVHTDPTRTKSLTLNWSAKKAGIDTKDNDSRGDTDGVTGPVVPYYVSLFCGNGGLTPSTAGGSNPDFLNFMITIDYIVRFDTLRETYPISTTTS